MVAPNLNRLVTCFPEGEGIPDHGLALVRPQLDDTLLEIAREGLHRRARRDACGEDETHFLDALFTIAGGGRTPAVELVEDYNTRWGGDIRRIYEEYSY